MTDEELRGRFAAIETILGAGLIAARTTPTGALLLVRRAAPDDGSASDAAEADAFNATVARIFQQAAAVAAGVQERASSVTAAQSN